MSGSVNKEIKKLKHFTNLYNPAIFFIPIIKFFTRIVQIAKTASVYKFKNVRNASAQTECTKDSTWLLMFRTIIRGIYFPQHFFFLVAQCARLRVANNKLAVDTDCKYNNIRKTFLFTV